MRLGATQVVPWNLSNFTLLTGAWFGDQANDRKLLVVNESWVNVNVLQLFDEGVEYSYISANEQCQEQSLGETDYQETFGWLKYASYAGNGVTWGVPSQSWQLSTPNSTLTIFTVNYAVPLRMTVAIANTATVIVDFFGFTAVQAPPSYFQVPSYCSKERPTRAALEHPVFASYRLFQDALREATAHAERALN
jgi:hypothetical protein